MIKPEQVPYDAVRAAHSAWVGGGGNNVLSAMERAIAAAINAWPGMSQLAEHDSASIREMAALILPLPQDGANG